MFGSPTSRFKYIFVVWQPMSRLARATNLCFIFLNFFITKVCELKWFWTREFWTRLWPIVSSDGATQRGVANAF